jgi:disulfide oxidoreductase YuzD
MHQQRGMGLIEKRPLLPSQKEFVDYIKSQTSINLISQNVDIPRTTIEHWFRKDEKGFSFPSVEDWTKIMEHLDCNHQDFEKMNFKLTYVVVETDDINKNNEKGKNPGSVSDFWDIPTKPSKNEHYASYNDELIRKPILAGCPENGIVYDPFMGTGSTAEVCLRAKRRFIGSEMNASYVDITNKRLEPFLKQNQLF